MNVKSRIIVVMLANLAVVCASLAGTETNTARGIRGPAEMEAFVDGVIAAKLESRPPDTVRFKTAPAHVRGRRPSPLSPP